MQPAKLQKKVRKDRQAEDPVDPYELVRRLSIVQAEETVKELERRRAEWETELRESCGLRQTQNRNRTQTTSNGQPQGHYHRRSASISLAPDQLPPPAYTDLPEPTRKQSLPSSFNRSHYTPSSRRPSLRRGNSGELATISENAIVEPTLENLFPEWAEKERRRASVLPKVSENVAPEVGIPLWKARRRSSVTKDLQKDDSPSASHPVSRRRSSCTAPISVLPPTLNQDCTTEAISDEWMPKRRSSAVSQASSLGQDSLNSDGQPLTRKGSYSSAQMENKKLDQSKSGETGRTRSRKASLLDKIEHYWKPGKVDPRDADPFDSKASTLRNSWRSSQGDPTASRRPSMLKTVGDYWFIDPPSSGSDPV